MHLFQFVLVLCLRGHFGVQFVELLFLKKLCPFFADGYSHEAKTGHLLHKLYDHKEITAGSETVEIHSYTVLN
jgi:hypothetical protein